MSIKKLSLAIMISASASFSPALAADQPEPIVFVHGDSDTSGLWIAQMWRFESNGYPADRLFAVDIPHPGARGDDTVEEINRSSTADAAKEVAAMVDRAIAETGSSKVVLVANSRGCQTSRNYVKNYGGLGKVSKMVLAGCVHNGVFVSADYAVNSEYNGAGTFLTALNAKPVIPEGVEVTILRSDRFDLYSQPDGKFIGNPGNPTGANYDSPELDGANNIVLAGADHRETGYSPDAFEKMFEAITGRKPETLAITPETAVTLNGKVSAQENSAPTNIPLVGARVSVFETDPATGARKGAAVHEKAIGEDGMWGPFAGRPDQTYEFVVSMDGAGSTRIYRSAFPRSSNVVNLRLYPAPLGHGFVNVMRPRGYFGPDDQATANGEVLPGIPGDEPVPHVWQSSVPAKEPEGAVKVTFNGETIVARSPAKGSDDTIWVELTY